MDIFDTTKRGQQDSIRKPVYFPEQSEAQSFLQKNHEEQLKLFNIYLNKLYAKFDFKINKCSLDCINSSKNYIQVKNCQKNCSQGVGKFSAYVDKRVGQMQQLLSQCVSNASTLPNTMDQIYYCYDRYNKGFTKLKQFITEQSLFYQ